MDQDKEKFSPRLAQILNIAKEETKSKDVFVEIIYHFGEDATANDSENNVKTSQPVTMQVVPDDVIEGILRVRDTGETNMYDMSQVQAIANRLDEFPLVAFLSDRNNHSHYWNFISHGAIDIEIKPRLSITFYGDDQFENRLKQKISKIKPQI